MNKSIDEIHTPVFPLRASDNGRYLVDNTGRPFMYHADTAWRTVFRLLPKELELYLEDRIKKGFTTLHMHSINKEEEGTANVYGQEPFLDGDMTRPNEPYWKHLDAVLDAAAEKNFFIVLSTSWFGYDGGGYRYDINISNARDYGLFIGKRYARFNNIMWILGGDNNPGDKVDTVCVMAAALRETAPHMLLTYHAKEEFSSGHFFQDYSWLDINLAYTYQAAHKHVLEEYHREPIKPVIFFETGYEEDDCFNFIWPAKLVRRQAYYGMLSGACGHAIGNRPIWRFRPEWKDKLNMESNLQMPYLIELFNSIEWWNLIPDDEHKFVTRWWRSYQDAENTVAAVTRSGNAAIVYIPTFRTLLMDLSLINDSVRMRWYDPTDGTFIDSGKEVSKDGNVWTIELNRKNAAGEEDWVILFESNQSNGGI